MKKIVCFLMAIVMLVLCAALYSCKKEKIGIEPPGEIKKESEKNTEKGENIQKADPEIVGTWKTKVSALNLIFPSDIWDTGSVDWKDNEIKLSLALTENGTIVLGLNKSETRDFVANNLESVSAMLGYTIEEVKEEGIFETDDDLIEDLLDTFASLNKTGKYTYEDGILTTELVSLTHTHRIDEEEEIPAQIRVKVTSDSLTFTEYVIESNKHAVFDKNLLPLTFKKIN